MKNTDLLFQKIEDSLTYLYSLDEKLKPLLDYLTDRMVKGLQDEEISVKEAFEMWLSIQEQYTNSILLQTKLKEILDYREV